VSIVVLTLLAGADQPHLYWVVAFSALVLHQGGPRVARTYRALHRLLGTVVGLALFLLVVTLHPTGWWLIGLIVLLQSTIELLGTRNYGLAVALITPLALLIASGGNVPQQPLPLVGERLLDTVIGVVVALVVLWGFGTPAHHRAVRGDTRRAVAALAAFARGDVPTRHEPTIASTLRDLHTSTSLLVADGHQDSPEARTAEAVTHAGFLMLGTRDRRTVAAAAPRWTEAERLRLPSGWRQVDDDDVDIRLRQLCAHMGAAHD